MKHGFPVASAPWELYMLYTGSHYLDYIFSNYRRKKTKTIVFFNYSKGLLCGDISASEVQ